MRKQVGIEEREERPCRGRSHEYPNPAKELARGPTLFGGGELGARRTPRDSQETPNAIAAIVKTCNKPSRANGWTSVWADVCSVRAVDLVPSCDIAVSSGRWALCARFVNMMFRI